MIDTVGVLHALSSACDLVGEASLSITGHGQQVAYASLRLAQEMGIELDDRRLLANAALIHDVGVSSTREFREVVSNTQLDEHCRHGAALLSSVQDLQPVSEIVLLHHHHASKLDPGVRSHLLANIIHLSDRVSLSMSSAEYPLRRRRVAISDVNSESGAFFADVIEAFSSVSREEAFWLDLGSSSLDTHLAEMMGKCGVSRRQPSVQMNLLEIASMLSKVIDAKSPFTAAHSVGVTNVAVELSRAFGFSLERAARMRVAGLMHDLGKLAVPDGILEKPGPLDPEEMLVMKQHTYHTKRILSSIRGFSDIARWAGHHHERLDGRGYPFRLEGSSLDMGSRIMAVSDIFQALNQDRPYRGAMARDEVETILERQVSGGGLDRRIVSKVLAEYEYYRRLALDDSVRIY